MTAESSGRGVGRTGEPEDGPPTLEVFWRPGCPYCSVLRRQLERRQVPATWRNIWDDPAARETVRTANSGNETVPTVQIGSQTLTNPSWRQLAPLLGEGPWQQMPTTRPGVRMKAVVSWSSVVLFVIIGIALTAIGHDGIAWAADALAVGAWWLTRPMRE